MQSLQPTRKIASRQQNLPIMDIEMPEPDREETKERKAVESKPLSDPDAEYLRTLVECEHQAIDQFDKTVLTLTGGAFAVSRDWRSELRKTGV